jgi:hypothetical protein
MVSGPRIKNAVKCLTTIENTIDEYLEEAVEDVHVKEVLQEKSIEETTTTISLHTISISKLLKHSKFKFILRSQRWLC